MRGNGTRFIVISFRSTFSDPSNRAELRSHNYQVRTKPISDSSLITFVSNVLVSFQFLFWMLAKNKHSVRHEISYAIYKQVDLRVAAIKSTQVTWPLQVKSSLFSLKSPPKFSTQVAAKF